MGKGKWDSLKNEVDNESTKIDDFSHNHTLHFLFFFDLLGARVFGRRVQ
jgi:hypothetical protein